ncbi:MAG: methyltransferase domain-containing protein [Bdellovibrionales bacterium]|nr:methyltransferase domain-containing protein [Bdellovibrionales bacterium]
MTSRLAPDDPRRLPVDHPGFKFHETRNPYYAKIRDLADGGAALDHDAEERRGKWRDLFRARAPGLPAQLRLVVEVGCNGGHLLNGWAEREPGTAFVGVDWKYKQIFLAADKARKKGLANALYVRNHADRIDYLFGEGEVDRLAVYFPDPWPKKSQWKNRTVREDWFRKAARVVRPGGELHIKTDHAGYFDWMEGHLGRCGELWETLELTRDLHAGHPSPLALEIPDVTLFERLFIRDGLPIHSMLLRRR